MHAFSQGIFMACAIRAMGLFVSLLMHQAGAAISLRLFFNDDNKAHSDSDSSGEGRQLTYKQEHVSQQLLQLQNTVCKVLIHSGSMTGGAGLGVRCRASRVNKAAATC